MAASRCLGAENFPQAFMTMGALGGHLGNSDHGCAALYTWDDGAHSRPCTSSCSSRLSSS